MAHGGDGARIMGEHGTVAPAVVTDSDRAGPGRPAAPGPSVGFVLWAPAGPGTATIHSSWGRTGVRAAGGQHTEPEAGGLGFQPNFNLNLKFKFAAPGGPPKSLLVEGHASSIKHGERSPRTPSRVV